MKEILPLTPLSTHSSSDLTTTVAKKSVAEARLDGTVSGISARQPDDAATFIDSLNDLVQARLTPDNTALPTGNSGKSLPLSTQAAEAIRPTLSPSIVEEQISTNADEVTLAALPLAASPTHTVAVDTPIAAASLSDTTNKAIAGTAPHSFDSTVIDRSLAMVNKSVTAEQLIARETVQITNTVQSLNAMNTSESPVIMQLSTTRPPALSQDLEQAADAIKHDLTQTSKPVRTVGAGEFVDRQQMLTTEGVINETDRLFTSRMQLVSGSPALELAGQKSLAETVINTTQPASADVLNASLIRSPLPQAGMPAESMAQNSQSFIPETVGKADWGQGMSKQILWMVNQNISRAEIRLNPANLGPLEVLIDMENDQVNVAFTSRHADVREAVEQALPRLREMLEEKGLNLSNTDVSQHSFAEQRHNAFAQADQNNNGFTPGHSSQVRDDQLADDTGKAQLMHAIEDAFNNGLVDYYI